MKITVKTLRFGTTDKSGGLDYSVYCDSSLSEDMNADQHRLMLELDIAGEEDVDRLCRTLLQVYHLTSDRFQNRVASRGDKSTSVEVVEIGPDWTFLTFSRHGSWPAFVKTCNLDMRNQLTYTDKRRMFALWDNCGKWYPAMENDAEDTADWA